MVDAKPAFSRPTNDFTTVELLWHVKRIENRIRFGHAVAKDH